MCMCVYVCVCMCMYVGEHEVGKGVSGNKESQKAYLPMYISRQYAHTYWCGDWDGRGGMGCWHIIVFAWFPVGVAFGFVSCTGK